MVDVSHKPVTNRLARASGFVTMQPDTLQKILNRQFSKGDVLEVARLAGIMGAKKTSDLIPLCHPLPLQSIQIDLQPLNQNTIRIQAAVGVAGQTGVEMEALTAVTICALTIYDMCKGVDRSMVIGPIELLEKAGGASGHFLQQKPAPLGFRSVSDSVPTVEMGQST